MYVANAYKRTKRSPKEDSGMAGAGKMPSVTARSRGELEELGKRMGWTPRTMTMAEVEKLSSQELLWREEFDADNLKAALELPSKLSEAKQVDKQWGAKRFWDKYWDTKNQADPEESNRILAELQKFISAYPQFLASRPENQVVLEYLKDRNLELNFKNLQTSYEENAIKGLVWVNPSAIACGSDSAISGTDLTSHHSFHQLLQAHKRPSDIDRLSADEFLAMVPDLKDKRTPPLIVARQARADATAAHFAQTESTTARSGSTNVIDYPQKPHGVPPQPDKISFRKKVQSMTADEVRRECEINPGFKQSLDDLK